MPINIVLILRSPCHLQVRDEIEHLLDDDNDMAEMYLTEKLSAFDHTSSREENFSAIKEEDERW